MRATAIQLPLALLAATAFADGWGNFASISGTEVGHLCNIVDNPDRLPHDIDCTTNNPYVDSSGNVGIGTTSPIVSSANYNLTIQSAAPQILLEDTSLAESADGRLIRLQSSNGRFDIMEAGRNGSAGTTGTSTLLSIEGTGNVGIGTTYPGSKLEIESSTASAAQTLFSLTSSANGSEIDSLAIDFRTNIALDGTERIQARLESIQTNVTGTHEGAFAISVLNDAVLEEKLRISDAGNVGIGTTTPQTKLEVTGTVSATAFTGDGSALAGISVSSDNIVSGTTNITANNSGAISFTTNGSEAVVIDSSGNVGIGTTAPSTELHVYSNRSSQGAPFKIEQDGIGDASIRFNLTGLSNWTVGIDNNDADKFKITNGSALSSTPRLTIDTSGNVGIGTTSPSATLHVAGTISTTSNVDISGTIKIASTGSDPCASINEGTIRFNFTTKRLEICSP